MKPSQRMKLINNIALKLQEEMTFSQIDMYLPAFNINCKNHVPSYNSKRVYVEELLSNESENIIKSIAEDLEIITLNTLNHKEIPTFWKDGYFKLFISHLAKHKKKASLLQKALEVYGISSFVAHEDIQPSREWQNEIENALFTMDGLCAILMEGFKESDWCDQEIGFAIGKEVLIIPIKKEINPYGFIGKYQAIKVTDNKTVGNIAYEVFSVIIKNPKTKIKMFNLLTSLISSSTNIDDALLKIRIIKKIHDMPKEILEKMINNVVNNIVLMDSVIFINELKDLSKKNEIDFKINNNNLDKIDNIDIPF